MSLKKKRGQPLVSKVNLPTLADIGDWNWRWYEAANHRAPYRQFQSPMSANVGDTLFLTHIWRHGFKYETSPTETLSSWLFFLWLIDLLGFVLPRKHRPGTDLMCKSILNNATIMDMVLDTVVGKQSTSISIYSQLTFMQK